MQALSATCWVSFRHPGWPAVWLGQCKPVARMWSELKSVWPQSRMFLSSLSSPGDPGTVYMAEQPQLQSRSSRSFPLNSTYRTGTQKINNRLSVASDQSHTTWRDVGCWNKPLLPLIVFGTFCSKLLKIEFAFLWFFLLICAFLNR